MDNTNFWGMGTWLIILFLFLFMWGNNAFGGKSGRNDILNTNIIPMSVNNLEIGAFMFRRLADKFNGLFIIENPNINISPDALYGLNGVKYIVE